MAGCLCACKFIFVRRRLPKAPQKKLFLPSGTAVGMRVVRVAVAHPKRQPATVVLAIT